MKYIGLKTEYDVEFSNLTKNLVQVKGDVPAKTHGFTLSRPGKTTLSVNEKANKMIKATFTLKYTKK